MQASAVGYVQVTLRGMVPLPWCSAASLGVAIVLFQSFVIFHKFILGKLFKDFLRKKLALLNFQTKQINWVWQLVDVIPAISRQKGEKLIFH